MKHLFFFLLFSSPHILYPSAPPPPPPPPPKKEAISYPKWFENEYLSEVKDQSKQGELKGIYNRMTRDKKSKDDIEAELTKKLKQLLAKSDKPVADKSKSKSSGGKGSESMFAEMAAKHAAQQAAQKVFTDISQDLSVVAVAIAPQNFVVVQKAAQPESNKKLLAQDVPKYPQWMLKKPYVSTANPQEIQAKLKVILLANKNKSDAQLKDLFDKALEQTVSIDFGSSGNAKMTPQEELKSKLLKIKK